MTTMARSQPWMGFLLLSVVVVNWNSREDLLACLSSLQGKDLRKR